MAEIPPQVFLAPAWPCSTRWRKAGAQISPHTPSWPRRCWCHLTQRAGGAKSLPSTPELQAPLPGAAIKTRLDYFSRPYQTSSGMTAPICCEERDEYLGIRRPRSYADRNCSFLGSPCASQVAAAGDRTLLQCPAPHCPPPQRVKAGREQQPPAWSPIPAGLGRGEGTKPNGEVDNSPCHQAGRFTHIKAPRALHPRSIVMFIPNKRNQSTRAITTDNRSLTAG